MSPLLPTTYPSTQQAPQPITSKVALTAVAQDVIEVPTTGTPGFKLVGILGANRSSADETVTVTIDDAGGATFRVIRLTLPHDSTVTWDPGGGQHYIVPGETMQAVATAANAVDLLFSFERIL